MFTTASLLYLYVESPLHAGVGLRDDTLADLPIQREEATGHPIIRASSLKGVFRSLARTTADQQDILAAFGPQPESLEEKDNAKDEEAFSGALVLGDAHLLLFPVRALIGVFAWVTSAGALARFQRDAAAYDLPSPFPPIQAPPPGTAWVTANSHVVTAKSQLVLEGLTFQSKDRQETAALGRWLANTVFPQEDAFTYWSSKVQTDLVVLPEEDFHHFVTARTEIIHRIRLDPETGTAVEGALWTEEFLPVDTVLYTLVAARAPAQPGKQLQAAQDVMPWFKDISGERIQIGGGRTLGRGLTRLRWDERSKNP